MEKKTDDKGHVLKKGERQRKNKTYEYRLWRDGRAYSVFAPTLKELRVKKENLIKTLDNNMDFPNQSKTLNYFADEYLNAKSITLEKSTYSTMKFMYDTYVRKELGNKKISEIKRSMVKKFYLGLLKDRNLSVTTIARIDGIVTPIFENAYNDDVIFKNPARGVCGEIKRETHAQAKKINVLTPEEQKRFIDFVIENPFYSDSMKNMLIVLCGTGLRVGELTALTWDNIDFKGNKINVCRSIAYIRDEEGHAKQFIKKPKTRAGIRKIPMIKIVRSALLSERQHQLSDGVIQPVLDEVTDFCFLSNRNTPFTREAINAQIKRMIKDYNSQVKDEKDKLPMISTHSIRHTFATALCQSTDDLKSIQDIMGHSDISITLNVYAVAVEKEKENSMDAFEKNFGNSLKR